MTDLKEASEIKSDIKVLAEVMKEGFKAGDKRFEAGDKQFEAMNKKFSMMFIFMNIWFGILILIKIIFKFIV